MITNQITIHDIRKCRDKCIEDIDVHKEVFEKAKQEFERQERIAKKPLFEMLNAYYDAICLDKNNETVKAADLVTNGKHTYLVMDRGMQIVLGHLCDNTKIMVKKTKDNGITTYGKREDISARDCKYFEIVK